MKVKLLKTKTTGWLLVDGLQRVTIKPVHKVTHAVRRQYGKIQENIQVDYIKKHISELSAQELYEAAVTFYGHGLVWTGNSVIAHTNKLIWGEKNQHSAMLREDRRLLLQSYEALQNAGVTKFYQEHTDLYNYMKQYV